ncbi:MAG: kelch repeat-containing protein, partial [Thermoanaerobaculia bacterium]
MKFSSSTSLILGFVVLLGVLVTTAPVDARPRPAEKTTLDKVGSSRATGTMTAVRSHHTLTLLFSGKVLAVGGSDAEGSALASAEIFDPASGDWTPAGSLLEARHDHTASLLPSGRVLVAGGRNQAGALASAEIYDPRTGAWSSVAGAELLSARWGHTATLLANGEVLVTGGASAGGPLDSAEIYDPDDDQWRQAGSMSSARDQHT